jgi:tRNA pseudouridine38-40 synthase
MTRWKLKIEYKGTDYAGWQRQDHARSVQQTIEDALFAFCQQDIRLHVAGRTDAGVHALGQVAHFDLDYGDRILTGESLARALNAHLVNRSVSILRAEPVADDFHARYSATSKLYTYEILNRQAMPALQKNLVWHIRRPLNIATMESASRHLLGRHDFSTFRAAQCQAKSPERTLDRLEIEEKILEDGRLLRIHAEARSFLHHQVRNIVGALALVGQDKWTPEDVKTALEARDRRKGGPTAPPDGLYLVQVRY